MKVPFSNNVVPFPGAAPQQSLPPEYLLMAAATMHEQGRLFEPEKKLDANQPLYDLTHPRNVEEERKAIKERLDKHGVPPGEPMS